MIATPLREEVEAFFACHPEALADPYPLYHRLQAEAPVYVHGSTCTITRYTDIVAVLRDPRCSADRNRGSHRRTVLDSLTEPDRTRMRAMMEFTGIWMLTADPPAHTRLRNLANRAFTPRVIARLRERIQQLTDELLDSVIGSGAMDVITTLAYPLPVTVIAELLGVPPEDRERIRHWCTVVAIFLDNFSNLDAMEETIAAFRGYLQEVIADRARYPRDDLLTALIAAEETGDALTEEELLAMCVLILLGGHETTTSLIGNGLLALLRQPDQLALLRDDPSLVPSAVEELLRYDSPVQNIARIPTENIVIAGTLVPAGTTMNIMLGAANRDAAQFPEPDRLDIRRRANRHLAFGHGAHFCIGAALARLEGQIAFTTLLRRLPDLQLAADTVAWYENVSFRGLKALPVTFRAGGMR